MGNERESRVPLSMLSASPVTIQKPPPRRSTLPPHLQSTISPPKPSSNEYNHGTHHFRHPSSSNSGNDHSSAAKPPPCPIPQQTSRPRLHHKQQTCPHSH